MPLYFNSYLNYYRGQVFLGRVKKGGKVALISSRLGLRGNPCILLACRTAMGSLLRWLNAGHFHSGTTGLGAPMGCRARRQCTEKKLYITVSFRTSWLHFRLNYFGSNVDLWVLAHSSTMFKEGNRNTNYSL